MSDGLKAFANKHADSDTSPLSHLARVAMTHRAGVAAISAGQFADKAKKSGIHQEAAEKFEAASKEMAAVSEHPGTPGNHQFHWKSRAEAHADAGRMHADKAKEFLKLEEEAAKAKEQEKKDKEKKKAAKRK